jgi:predicted DNA-binding transcriptional regulator YafY
MSSKKNIIDNNDVKNQVKKLRLTEWVDRDKVADAIKNNDVVYIYYAGDKTVNKGYRTIEPYVLGRSKAGNLVLRAWQQAGATDRGNNPTRKNDEIPGWRLFRLDGITSLVKTLRKFETDASYIASNRPNYNPADTQMSQIIVAIDPAKQGQAVVSGNTSINKPDVQITQPTGFFKNQADKFRNFFRKPDDFSTTWIENQKRLFKELIKRKKE